MRSLPVALAISNVFLTVHGVDGEDAAGQAERFDQALDGWDLVRLRLDDFMGQDDPMIDGESAQHMRRLSSAHAPPFLSTCAAFPQHMRRLSSAHAPPFLSTCAAFRSAKASKLPRSVLPSIATKRSQRSAMVRLRLYDRAPRRDVGTPVPVRPRRAPGGCRAPTCRLAPAATPRPGRLRSEGRAAGRSRCGSDDTSARRSPSPGSKTGSRRLARTSYLRRAGDREWQPGR